MTLDEIKQRKLAEIEAERARLPKCDNCGSPAPLSYRDGHFCEECYSAKRREELEAEGIVGRCTFCGFVVTAKQPHSIDLFDQTKVAHLTCYDGHRFDELS